MKQTFLSRTDENFSDFGHFGGDTYDSITWAFETHVKIPNCEDFNYAILYGNEDSPEKIEFFKDNNYKEVPELTWYRDRISFEKNYVEVLDADELQDIEEEHRNSIEENGR